jgi:uncharacterized protein (TIGR03000 family)
MIEKLVRVLTWTIFGLGFVLVVLVAVLASFTGRPMFAQQPGSGGVRSKVRVTLPAANAELFIETKLTKTAGLVREFDTPDVEPGKRYEYQLKAVWKPNEETTVTRTRNVKFSGGEEVTLDLTKDDGTDEIVVKLKPMTADAIADICTEAAIAKTDVVVIPDCTDARWPVAVAMAGAKRVIALQADATKAKTLRDEIRKTEADGAIDVLPTAPADYKDYAEASVVLLYLGEERNNSLRAKLLNDVKPATRIVSYKYAFADWKPKTTKKAVNSLGEEYPIHAWAVTTEDKARFGKK